MKPLAIIGLGSLGLASLSVEAAGFPDYLQPTGYLQYDLTRIDSRVTSLDDASQWRRIRLGFKGRLDDRLDYAIERDFADDTWKDLRLRLKTGHGHWSIGQFKQPFSLWALDSDRRTLLPESAATALVAPDRRLGLMWQHLAAEHTLAISGYGENVDGIGPDWGLAARATLLHPFASGQLHLGLALGHEHGWPDRSFSLRPEIASAAGRFDRSPSLAADEIDRWGLEIGWQRGPITVQGEWMGLRLDGPGTDPRTLTSGYAMVNWTVIGTGRGYTNGLFTTGEASGTVGPLDLSLRYGSVDLPGPRTGASPELDDDALGQNTWTLGATLALGPWVRLQSAFTLAEDERGRNADIWQLRMQLQY